jgi:hypothetical protein
VAHTHFTRCAHDTVAHTHFTRPAHDTVAHTHCAYRNIDSVMNLRTDLSLAVNKQQARTPPAPVNEDSEDTHGDSNADSNADNKVDLELITSFNIFRFEEVQVR